ncbi:putative inorganic phosphate cotransporter isoform X1 [Schistocerca nitens]|uniref:putative inorganic phosphate cotransporter isoform X1 n=1 Tax=Schistocerca nitens TaxID=7011 RepID=UPI002118B7A6|nr:putative inorganic phosphate cotransporter isoform X1 [Schistocerca nitens]
MATKEHQPDPEKHQQGGEPDQDPVCTEGWRLLVRNRAAATVEGVPVLGVRHLQALLLCIAHVLVFSLRTNMSVAVVVMANNTAGNPNIKDYGWSQSETSTILSSFFWGYVVMQAPAGWAADRFNSKNLFSASLILSGVLTVLTEVAADTGGVVLVCAFRVVMGLAQGFVFPCTHSLLAKWIPPKESDVLGTAVYTGDQLGTVVAMMISGALAQSALGWPSIFYFFGGLSILWGVILFWFGGNTPSGHKHISSAELIYIEESWKDVSRERKKFPTPWISIFTSLPVFACIVATLSLCWGYYTLLTEIPTYLSNVLGFDIASNGLLSALPYVVNCALSLSFSWIINSVEKKEIFSKGTLRKVANSIGYWIPAAALVALSFIPVEDPTAAVILLTVSVGFNSISIMGYQMNLIDIAPNFSGLMMGVTGSIGTLMSVAAPLYVGAVVKENTIQEWRIVFLTAAAVFFVGNLIFVIFGDGEVQPWNDPNYSRGKKTETIEKVAV